MNSSSTETSFQLGKRSHRELTAARRQIENETFQELAKCVPLGLHQAEKSNRIPLLRLTISFIKARGFMKTAGVDYQTLKFFSLEDSLNFYGFVLLVDLSGNVLYATEKITEQLGPYLSDVVGEPASSLIHPEDVEQLKRVFSMVELPHSTQPRLPAFGVRMKTVFNPSLKECNQKYKNVFITCHLKSLENTMRKGSEDSPSESHLLVLLCRTEELIGFPEIVMGSYVDFETNLPEKTFTKIDSKGPWLLGYKSEDIVGKDTFLFRHPSDTPPQHVQHMTRQLLSSALKSEGMFRFAKVRFLTAWGDWVWTQTELSPLEMQGEDVVQCQTRVYILGPDDFGDRPREWKTSGASFCANPESHSPALSHSVQNVGTLDDLLQSLQSDEIDTLISNDSQPASSPSVRGQSSDSPLRIEDTRELDSCLGYHDSDTHMTAHVTHMTAHDTQMTAHGSSKDGLEQTIQSTVNIASSQLVHHQLQQQASQQFFHGVRPLSSFANVYRQGFNDTAMRPMCGAGVRPFRPPMSFQNASQYRCGPPHFVPFHMSHTPAVENSFATYYSSGTPQHQ